MLLENLQVTKKGWLAGRGWQEQPDADGAWQNQSLAIHSGSTLEWHLCHLLTRKSNPDVTDSLSFIFWLWGEGEHFTVAIPFQISVCSQGLHS